MFLSLAGLCFGEPIHAIYTLEEGGGWMTLNRHDNLQWASLDFVRRPESDGWSFQKAQVRGMLRLTDKAIRACRDLKPSQEIWLGELKDPVARAIFLRFVLCQPNRTPALRLTFHGCVRDSKTITFLLPARDFEAWRRALQRLETEMIR